MRCNPLTQRAFCGIGVSEAGAQLATMRIRATVLAAVAALARGEGNVHHLRQRAIVTRCDLHGEKHTVVAADLGVSLREFYRERRRAFERLSAQLASSASTAVTSSAALPSQFEIELDHAANLRLVGSFPTAFERLERLAAEAVLAEDAVRALCYAVEIAADIGDDERARRWYAGALKRAGSMGSCGPAVELQLAMSDAYVAWPSDGLDTAIAAIDRAASSARTLEPVVRRHDLRCAVNALFARSELGCLMGDPSASLQALRDARRLLERLRYKPPELLGQLFLEFSVVYGLVPGEQRRGFEYAVESIRAFESAGIVCGIADAMGVLSGHLGAGGEFVAADRYAAAAVGLARGFDNAATLADKLLVWSSASTAAGAPHRGLSLAGEAQGLTRGGLFDFRIPLAQAEALIQCDRPGEAAELAKNAGERAGRLRMVRYTGAAARLQALAAHAAGNYRLARQLATLAIEAAVQFGHPASIASAYETCARLGVSHPAMTLGREIRAALNVRDGSLAELLPPLPR